MDEYFFFLASLFNVYTILEAAENTCGVSPMTQTLGILCLVDSEDLTLALTLLCTYYETLQNHFPTLGLSVFTGGKEITSILTNSQADRRDPMRR